MANDINFFAFNTSLRTLSFIYCEPNITTAGADIPIDPNIHAPTTLAPILLSTVFAIKKQNQSNSSGLISPGNLSPIYSHIQGGPIPVCYDPSLAISKNISSGTLPSSSNP